MYTKTITNIPYTDKIFAKFNIRCKRKESKNNIILMMDNIELQVTELISITSSKKRTLKYITMFGEKYLIKYTVEIGNTSCEKINDAMFTIYVDKNTNYVSGKIENSDVITYLNEAISGARLSCHRTVKRRKILYEVYSANNEEPILYFPYSLIVEVSKNKKKIYPNAHHCVYNNQTAVVRCLIYDKSMNYIEDEYFSYNVGVKKKIYCSGDSAVVKTKLMLMYDKFLNIDMSDPIIPLLKYL